MKWGIRRFRNTDGSLTPAGKERYGHDPGKRAKTVAEIKAKRIHDSAEESRKRVHNAIRGRGNVRDLSDEELGQVLGRLSMEQRYSTLMDQLHPKREAWAKKFVTTTLNNIAYGIVDAKISKMKARLSEYHPEKQGDRGRKLKDITKLTPYQVKRLTTKDISDYAKYYKNMSEIKGNVSDLGKKFDPYGKKKKKKKKNQEDPYPSFEEMYPRTAQFRRDFGLE